MQTIVYVCTYSKLSTLPYNFIKWGISVARTTAVNCVNGPITNMQIIHTYLRTNVIY